MAKELQSPRYVTGRTVYAVIRNAAGQAWNGAAFEAVDAANWATYDVACPELSTTGYYAADRPAGISALTPCTADFFHQAGGSPATSDALFGTQAIGPADANAVQFAGQTVTCAAGVTVGAFVGQATAALGVDASGRVVVQATGLDLVQVAGVSLPTALRRIGAATAGECSGAGTGTVVFVDWAGVTCFTSTVSSGNRTDVSFA